jgi:hypothetical protein
MRLWILVVMLFAPLAARAQDVLVRPELRPFVGASFPMADQRQVLDQGAMAGMQLAVQFGRGFHVVGSFGWMDAPSVSTGVPTGVTGTDIAQYDIGVELNFGGEVSRGWSLAPFLGVGGGWRRYGYDVQAALTPLFKVGDDNPVLRTAAAGHMHQSSFGSYFALGMELHFGPTALRLETRTNVFPYRSPDPTQDFKMLADLGLTLGLAYHFH